MANVLAPCQIILMEKRASTLLVRCEEGFHCEYTGDTRASGNLHPAVVATDLWLNKFSIFKSHWLRDHQDTHWTSLILAVRHRLQQCCLIFTVSSMVVRCPYKRILKEPAMTTGTHTSPHCRNEYFNSTSQKATYSELYPNGDYTVFPRGSLIWIHLLPHCPSRCLGSWKLKSSSTQRILCSPYYDLYQDITLKTVIFCGNVDYSNS